MRTRQLMTFILLFVVNAGGCRPWAKLGTGHGETQIDKIWQTDATPAVTIAMHRGNLRVVAGTSEQVRVRGKFSGDPSQLELTAANGVGITVGPDLYGVLMHVEVPTAARLKLAGGAAAIAVRGLSNDTAVITEDGTITGFGMTGKVELVSRGGDIHLQGDGMHAALTTQSGGISVDAGTSALTTYSDNGATHVTAVSLTAGSIASDSGDIRITGATSAERYGVSSERGQIRIVLRADMKGTFEIAAPPELVETAFIYRFAHAALK